MVAVVLVLLVVLGAGAGEVSSEAKIAPHPSAVDAARRACEAAHGGEGDVAVAVKHDASLSADGFRLDIRAVAATNNINNINSNDHQRRVDVELAVAVGSRRAASYALFAVAERACRPGQVAAQDEPRSSTAFAFRAWCETGILLDLPDVGYYTPTPPSYVNASRLAAEAAELKAMIPSLLQMRQTAFVLFQPALDDYINYETVDSGLFPRGSVHANRSAVFAAVVDGVLAEMQAAGLETYVATFEPTYPRALAEQLNLTGLTPDLERFFAAKFAELFQQRLPHLDGLMVYAADNWGDRGMDYKFPRAQPVWHGGRQLGQLAAMLQRTLLQAGGRRLIFSLWEGASTFADFVTTAPANVTVMVHLTYPGFYLQSGLNPVITAPAAKNVGAVYVSLDPYREHDGGWTRMVSVPGQLWQRGLREVYAQIGPARGGVMAFANWGASWSWPNFNSDGFLLNTSAGFVNKSWALPWARSVPYLGDSARITGQDLNGLVFAALGWDALNGSASAALATYFAEGPLQLDNSSALRLAGALLQSESLWLGAASTGSFLWQMVFNPQGDEIRVDGTLEEVQAQRAAVAEGGAKMVSESTAVLGSSKAEPAAGLLTAVQRTALWLDTLMTFRAAASVHPRLAGNASRLCPVQRALLGDLGQHFQAFSAASFRQDSALFGVCENAALYDIRPEFFRSDNNRTMLGWVEHIFQPELAAVCS